MIPDKINNVTPIKDNKQDWFDNEIADALKIREKYFKKVKKKIFRQIIIFIQRRNLYLKTN